LFFIASQRYTWRWLYDFNAHDFNYCAIVYLSDVAASCPYVASPSVTVPVVACSGRIRG